MSFSESVSLVVTPRSPSVIPATDLVFFEPFESRSQYRHRWFSLSVAYSQAFLLGVQESIYWVSLWPFLSVIDPAATENFFGFIIMAFNLGSALTGPIYGLAVNRFRQTRFPIAFGVALTIVGNLMVGFVESFPKDNARWYLMLGRFVTGLGVGTEGSIFAYIAMGSKPAERNKAVSIRAAIMSSSILLGPAMQTAFVPIGYPGLTWGPFHLNMYTAPAFVNVVIGIIQVLVMLTLFREFWISVDKDCMTDDKNGEAKMKPYDKVALGVGMWVRFAQLFCLVYSSTVNTPFTMVMFAWSATDAVLYNGIITVCNGLVDCIGNLIVGNIVLRYVQERKLILLGISVFILYFLVSFSWPGLPPLLSASLYTNNFSTSASTINETATCSFSWCSYTTRIYLGQFISAMFFFVISVSIAFTPNATLFSKMVGPRKQGTIQGLFYASGQVATTVGPVVCSNVFQFYGPRAAWIVGMSILAATVVLVAIFYKRMVPGDHYRAPESQEGERQSLIDKNGAAQDGYDAEKETDVEIRM